tara:strand:- start:356 stop:1183 length:828 start_codon:yes stop_codon:yes gene_type:complete
MTSNRPFLKWAGNKFRIIDEIIKYLPDNSNYDCFVEPFAGTCSVFLNTNYKKNFLADENPDLINLYLYLQKEGDKFIKYCAKFFDDNSNLESTYYENRDIFNNTKSIRKKSALFVYLNRHSYNGLCRYNSKGKFNAPFGRYIKIYFPHETMLKFFEKSQRAEFKCQDFKTTLKDLSDKRSVIYCDPPYLPLSDTAHFTKYSQGNFGLEEHTKLAEMIDVLKNNKDNKIILSNHYIEKYHGLYKNAIIKKLSVPRYISCNTETRKNVDEILVLYNI